MINYLNNLYVSKNVKDLFNFYSCFQKAEELVEWMKKRPNGKLDFLEIEGDKNIIVVVVTPDFNGTYAESCKEIYMGLHIIFVGGEGKENPYFNPAHYFNAGIRKALSYSPNWIIVSSDDMIRIDDSSVLVEELRDIDPSNYDVVWTKSAKYHSIPVKLCERNFLGKIAFFLIGWRREQLKIEKKFDVRYFPCPKHSYRKFFFKRGYDYISMADFGIFSSNFIRKNADIFDECYQHGGFDDDLSLTLSVDSKRSYTIDYRIGDLFGSTLGNDSTRVLRDLSGLIYLNYKIMNRLHPASDLILKK